MSAWTDDAISAYIDNRMTDKGESERIKKLFSDNPDARLTATVLRTVKDKARNAGAATAIQAPDVLRVNILSAIRQESRSMSPVANTSRVSVKGSILQSMLSFITRPIVAFPTVIAVCFAGWFAYTSLKSTTDHEHNFYSDSMRNYDAILGGAIKVQYSTGNFDSLTKFFKNSGIDYELVHPYINAELVGGVVSDEHGKKLAHMVYKKDGKLIYMYEVPEELFATHAMHVPAHVQPYAESGKWYSSVDPEHHHSWMFWRVKTTYCSVVSDLSKEQLADLFVKGV